MIFLLVESDFFGTAGQVWVRDLDSYCRKRTPANVGAQCRDDAWCKEPRDEIQCNTQSKKCVQHQKSCANEGNCANGFKCISEKCFRECTTAADCDSYYGPAFLGEEPGSGLSEEWYCETDTNTCRKQYSCEEDGDCCNEDDDCPTPRNKWKCNTATKQCVENRMSCSSNGDTCSDNFTCVEFNNYGCIRDCTATSECEEYYGTAFLNQGSLNDGWECIFNSALDPNDSVTSTKGCYKY